MGFDVTLHPMSAAEMGEWLFRRLPEARAGDLGPARALVGGRGQDPALGRDSPPRPPVLAAPEEGRPPSASSAAAGAELLRPDG